MLFFPKCKINLGLHVTEKRADGFHNIETVFYPVNWCDALEVLENKDHADPITLTLSGTVLEGDLKDNLIFRAWQLISEIKVLPPIKVHLHKIIPSGAGLGGGSSDAAFFVNLVDKKFKTGLSYLQKTELASKLGSDCAFFIENKPVLAKGKGNEFSEIKADLKKYYILLVYPNIHVNTKDAYSELVPKNPLHDLKTVIEKHDIGEWKDLLVNDFENSVFQKNPEIKELKKTLYSSGAVYASMSGSGSTVFGIFTKKPNINFPVSFKYFLQNPYSNVL